MSKFTFGNFEVEFDPTDVAFVEKYEVLAEEYNRRITAISKDDKASEVMQQMCNVFYDVFNKLFGKETGAKMFGQTNSVALCVKAFKQLIDMMNDYTKTLEFLPNVTEKPTAAKAKKK